MSAISGSLRVSSYEPGLATRYTLTPSRRCRLDGFARVTLVNVTEIDEYLALTTRRHQRRMRRLELCVRVCFWMAGLNLGLCAFLAALHPGALSIVNLGLCAAAVVSLYRTRRRAAKPFRGITKPLCANVRGSH